MFHSAVGITTYGIMNPIIPDYRTGLRAGPQMNLASVGLQAADVIYLVQLNDTLPASHDSLGSSIGMDRIPPDDRATCRR